MNTMTATEYAGMIRRAARNLANGLTLESRAYRFGFDAGFRGQPTGHADSIQIDRERRDWLAGHNAGRGERRDFDSLDPVTITE